MRPPAELSRRWIILSAGAGAREGVACGALRCGELFKCDSPLEYQHYPPTPHTSSPPDLYASVIWKLPERYCTQYWPHFMKWEQKNMNGEIHVVAWYACETVGVLCRNSHELNFIWVSPPLRYTDGKCVHSVVIYSNFSYSAVAYTNRNESIPQTLRSYLVAFG